MKNPQAFPKPSLKQSGEVSTSNWLSYEESGEEGMTLLDYFAGQTLIGTLSSDTKDESWGRIENDKMSKYCYDIAEAMLKEREKRIK